MRKIVLVGVFIAGVAVMGAGPALAASNPGGTGPPNQTCQDITAAGGTSPGHASTSPGSPFNEPSGSNPGGKGGTAYNNAGAPSQYDVACYQVSQH